MNKTEKKLELQFLKDILVNLKELNSEYCAYFVVISRIVYLFPKPCK